MNLEKRAELIAIKAHKAQAYDELYPYEYHLFEVVNIVKEVTDDKTLIVSAMLHDILEDTGLSYNDIKKEFGEEIAEIVYCVTDELGRNRKERKAKTYPKIASNDNAIFIKICDRIANIRYSKSKKSKQLKMYLDEYQEFCKNLKSINYDNSPLLFWAWNELDIEIKGIKL